jgi:NAD(P)-dependent dehydrogenase (short-subunit alcohol dehydrogenase family)
LDLASFDSVKHAARTVLADSNRLDVLMENAGIMAAPPALTKEGYELQFGTNHVGHALLARLLMPLLLKTAATPGADVRVVVLSSMGVTLAPAGGIQFDKLKTKCEEMSSWVRYGQSKVANALFARQLAKEHRELTVAAVHPGGVNTNLGHFMKEQSALLNRLYSLASLVLATVETGARNQLWASVANDVVSGEYYVPIGVRNKGPATIRDDVLAKKLWNWTEEELKGQEV